MSQRNGWMTHSISACASRKQITFINTNHTPGFFRMFYWWLVMEFQNPAPEAGRLLKTAQTLDKQTRSRGGSPPAPAGDSSSRAAGPAPPAPAAVPARASPAARERLRALPAPRDAPFRAHPCAPCKALCFLLREPKWTLSNVNLLCSFKPTLSAALPGSVFARISKIS